MIKNKKGILYSICIMLFIDAIGTGIIFPIMPQLFYDPHNGLITSLAANRALLYSISLAAFPLMGILGMPFFGVMSDRFGKKPLLLIGLGALILNYLMIIFAIFEHNIILFILARFCGGFISGIYAIGGAIVSDISNSTEDMFANMKLPAIADKLGMLIGPALSMFIYNNHHIKNELAIPFIIAISLAIFNIIMLYFSLRSFPSIKKPEQLSEPRIKLTELFVPILRALKQSKLRLYFASFFFYQFAAGVFIQGISLYLYLDHGFNAQQIGRFSAIMCLVILFSMYGPTKLLVKFINHNKLMKIFMPMMIIILYISFLRIHSVTAPSDIKFSAFHWQIWLLGGAFYLFHPVIRIIFTTQLLSSTSKTENGTMMGSAGQLSSLSYSISGFFVGGILTKHILILFTASLMLISFILLIYFLKKEKEDEEASLILKHED